MRLYLDDLRDPPVGWMLARTVEEAISHAKAMHARDCFDEASLDHDMGATCPYHDGPIIECNHTCGLDFIDWMIESGIWPKKKPTVHSMNPSGAQRMRQAIDRYYVAPPVDEKATQG